MSSLPLTYFGNPILRTKGKPVEKIDQEIIDLVHAMEKTMDDHNGIGLAAPQVGRSLRLFITRAPRQSPDGEWVEGDFLVFINPIISEPSDESWLREEGCLSIPKVYGNVERPLKITVEAQDLSGKVKKMSYSGLQARVIMHENDHINGVLFVDRMDKKERKALEQQLREIKKKFN